MNYVPISFRSFFYQKKSEVFNTSFYEKNSQYFWKENRFEIFKNVIH